MKILIVLGHPDANSLNHAIAHAVRDDLLSDGHDVMFHDLYEEGFFPLLAAEEIPESGKIDQIVETHCHELSSADGIVIVHPNWWGQPPAILKGWVDRVFRPGVAYKFEEGDAGEGIPIGLLNASTAIVINTSNTPAAREQTAFGDPLETIWRRCIFDLCGVKNFHRRMFSVVVTSTMEQRLCWLEEAKLLCRTAILNSVHKQRLTLGWKLRCAPFPPVKEAVYLKMKNILKAISDGPFLKHVDVKDDLYWEYPSLLGVNKVELDKIIHEWPKGIDEEGIQSLVLSCIGILLAYPHGKKNQLEKWTGMDEKGLESLEKILREKGWEVI